MYPRIFFVSWSACDNGEIFPLDIACFILQFSKATPPKIERKEANYIEIEDIERILFYSAKEPLKWELALNILIFTGCRRGEIMGLKWSDIDFKNHSVQIKRTLLYSTDKGI